MSKAATRVVKSETFDLDLLHDLVGYHLHRVEIESYRRFTAISSSDKITPKQYSAMVLVMANRDISQADLGRILGMDRASTTTMIDKLEKSDWVMRHPSTVDRRRHALRLSDTGKRLMDRMSGRVLEHDNELTRALTPEERGSLMSLLLKIRGSIERDRA